MKYLKIKNNGELDIRLVALMGGTTKSNNEFKIGQFGTGLKYTLAYLIRNNIDFHVFVGNEKVNINTVQEIIGQDTFNIICINNNRTSITDKMGLEWQAWMIIRELWCNALDEGGALTEVTPMDFSSSDLNGGEGTTTFYIQVTKEIQDIVDNWTKYFIHDQTPVFNSEHHAIYAGGEDLRIYKQGVLIKEVKGRKSLFSYDEKYATINELREYNGSVGRIIFKSLQYADPKTIQYFLENVTEKHYEGSDDIDYNWFESFGELWKKTIGSAKIIHKEAVKTIQDRGIDIDLTGMLQVPKKIYEALTSQIDGIGALRVSSKIKEFYETYSSASDEKIKQALVILEEAGYNFSPELKFIYGVFGDKTVWAQINFDTKEVYISENIADKSLFDVVTTLVEENEHFKTGMEDCSRPFQQHFIDLYVNTLLKSNKILL